MADVFLSYASADAEEAQRIASALEDAGYSVWWDRHLMSGERFQQSIQRELTSAAAVVAVWTKTSVESEWVYSEARRGNQRKALVQVRARDVEIDDLPAPFDALHCPLGDDTDALLRSVAALVHQSRPEPAVVVPDRERKTVTVLVADYHSATPVDPEDVAALSSLYHAGCRRVIERFGGTCDRLAGDAIMAAFGAQTAHEDDAERAVRAALEICVSVEQLDTAGAPGVSVRIGVATGEAVVSRFERTEFGESMLTGHVVNAALQLQSAAPTGGVLVDEATHRPTRASIEYEAHDLAGAWLVLGSRGSAGEDVADSSRPMVGREDELAQLQQSFARAVHDSSLQLVTIVAEPGLGKSRLVQAFSDWVEARDDLVTWRLGRCPPYGETVAYASLVDIVKAQTGILDSDVAEVAQRRLDETVDALVAGTDLEDQGSWLASRLAPLVGLASAEAKQPELFTAWRRFLEALAATGPLVLVIEDLHWADPAMLAFLTHLLEWTVGVPLLIVATARPELHDKAPNWAAGQRNASTLTLAPLTESETALVTSLLGTRTLAPDLQAALLRKAAGNPLYAREYVGILTDHSDPDVDEVRVKELALTLPGSVHAVIAARLDILPAESKRLLQAAAVVGHTFWSAAVATLMGVDESIVDRRLHKLARRDYLRPSRTSRIVGQHEYAFAHALIADVAYGQLTRPDRGRFHHIVADWHAARVTDPDVSADSALVAHHYSEAYDLGRRSDADGANLAVLAASAAIWHAHAAEHGRRTEVTTALAHAERAVELSTPEDPALARRLLEVARMLTQVGRDSDAETMFEKAQLAAERVEDPVTGALAKVRRSDVLRWLGRADEADALLNAAIDSFERHGPSPELAQAYVSLAEAHTFQGRFRAAVESADRAVAVLGHLEQPPYRQLLWALGTRGQAFVYLGDPRAPSDLERALSIAEAHHETGELNFLQNNLGMWSLLTESPEAACRYRESAVRTAELTGQRAGHLTSCATLSEALVIAGRLDEAAAVCERATVEDVTVDSTRAWAIFWTLGSWVHVVRGELQEADATIERALPHAREDGGDLLVAGLLVAAEGHQAADDRESLTAMVGELVALAQVSEMGPMFTEYLPRLIRVLAAAQELELAGRIIAAAPTGTPLHDHNRLAASAVLADASGQHEEALTLHEQAAAAWADYGYPLEHAHSLLGTAFCRAELGQPAREPLLEAALILERMGAAPLLAHTRRLLAEEPAES